MPNIYSFIYNTIRLQLNASVTQWFFKYVVKALDAYHSLIIENTFCCIGFKVAHTKQLVWSVEYQMKPNENKWTKLTCLIIIHNWLTGSLLAMRIIGYRHMIILYMLKKKHFLQNKIMWLLYLTDMFMQSMLEWKDDYQQQIVIWESYPNNCGKAEMWKSVCLFVYFFVFHLFNRLWCQLLTPSYISVWGLGSSV